MSGSARPIAIVALSLFLSVPSACTWSFGSPEPETNEMHRRFSRTVDIQTGVVLGDLSRAQAGAAWLATYQETEGSNGAAESHDAEIRGYASFISQASDLDSVAQRVGHIAAACGNCHTATEGGPRFVLGSHAPDASSPAGAMIRHLWAADRMWEGLVGPSEEAWMAGARALGANQVWGSALFQASSNPEASTSYLAQIRELGRRAEEARTQAERATVYADMLNTCRGCHASAGVMAEG